MSHSHVTISFGGGFMYVFEGDKGGSRWSSLAGGTVKPAGASLGYGVHQLTLVRVAGSVEESTLAAVPGEPDDSWDLSGCRVEVDPLAASQGVLAPLDPDAAPPDRENEMRYDLQWENWKWVLDPVGFHQRAGTLVSEVRHDWPDRLDSAVVVRSGVIVPQRGFDEVNFRAAGRVERGPVSNVTRWHATPDTGKLVLEVSGRRTGRLTFAATHGTVSLEFLHHEPMPPMGPRSRIRDLAMIYALIEVQEGHRITEGVISGEHIVTPGKTCGSARFVAP